jgi:hypothetical protein
MPKSVTKPTTKLARQPTDVVPTVIPPSSHLATLLNETPPVLANLPAWLTPDDALPLRRAVLWHSHVQEHARGFVFKSVLVGLSLQDLKDRVAHGRYAELLESGALPDAGISERTARRYVQAAKCARLALAARHPAQQLDPARLLADPYGADLHAVQGEIMSITNAETWTEMIRDLGGASKRPARGGFRPSSALVRKFAAAHHLDPDTVEHWPPAQQAALREYCRAERRRIAQEEAERDPEIRGKRLADEARKSWSTTIAKLYDARSSRTPDYHHLPADERQSLIDALRAVANLIEETLAEVHP